MASTGELIDKVLDDIKAAAARGEPDAVGALRDLTDGATAPADTPVVVKETRLIAAAKVIKRPNGVDYHVRRLGVHDDVAALQAARVAHMSPLLTGYPGTGKTALIEAAFYEPDKPDSIEYIQGSGDTMVADFIGGYVPDGVSYRWVDGPLIRAMENGSTLYVDEIALIDPKVLATLYGVMDGRLTYYVTENPAHPPVTAVAGFFVAAACNPNAPGARMSEALVSRFPLQFQVTTDYVLAKKLGVPPKVVTAAQNLGSKLEKSEGIAWAPQLRELLAYRDMAITFGEEFALNNLVSNAPENDREIVADVLTRSTGKSTTELRTSGS